MKVNGLSKSLQAKKKPPPSSPPSPEMVPTVWCRNWGHLFRESRAIRGSLFKAWCRPECRTAGFACCQQFFPFWCLPSHFINSIFFPVLFQCRLAYYMNTELDFYLYFDKLRFILTRLLWPSYIHERSRIKARMVEGKKECLEVFDLRVTHRVSSSLFNTAFKNLCKEKVKECLLITGIVLSFRRVSWNTVNYLESICPLGCHEAQEEAWHLFVSIQETGYWPGELAWRDESPPCHHATVYRWTHRHTATVAGQQGEFVKNVTRCVCLWVGVHVCVCVCVCLGKIRDVWGRGNKGVEDEKSLMAHVESSEQLTKSANWQL